MAMTVEPQDGSRSSVMVADGDMEFRARLASALRGLGRYEVVAEVATAAEWRRLLRGAEPELVVMDLSLARTVGLRAECLGALLPRPPKIVLLAGEGDRASLEEELEEAMDAGVRGFVGKDLDPALLDSVLGHVLVEGCAIDAGLLAGLNRRSGGSPVQFARAHQRISLLNESERQVLELLGRGFGNARIAEELRLSRASVKTYVSRLLSKLHLQNRTQAALVANEAGLTGHAGPGSLW
ncbi:LuxR C-terminal-related transcriptional regulator [Streptomyces lavendulae]|uniref:LuxR C-terminal-related transcriptional regulator n=1 Tax=Streptomyces lavendulae TaxID=1914 RepID=UPI00368EA7E2